MLNTIKRLQLGETKQRRTTEPHTYIIGFPVLW